MRIYIEVKEETARGIDGDFIRVDITDYTQPEITAITDEIKNIMSGKTYELRKHYCGHDEDAACTFEGIS